MNNRCYDEQDDYKYLFIKIKRLEYNLKYTIKRLDEMEKHIKDIDMDMDDLFDDVEGKHEDNHK